MTFKCLKASLSCLLLLLALSLVSAQIPSPSILINPVEGPVGSSVSVRGTNFLMNSEVRVFWEDKHMGSGKTDSKGSFSVSIKVPEVPCGYYKIMAIDEVKNNAYTTFRVIPKSLKLSATQSIPGSSISISGSGFSANSEVEVRLVDPFSEMRNLAVKRVLANESGVINVHFEIPDVPPGEYKIYALDAKTGLKTDQYKFTVQIPKTTPPPATTTPEQNQQNQTDKEKPKTTPTTPNTPVTYTPRKTPGFEIAIAIVAIAAALSILRRR